MISILATLAALATANCDVESPSGQGLCTRAAVDGLRVDQIQTFGTHNSFKQLIPPAELALIAAQRPDLAQSIDYGHQTLTEELDGGARNLELDPYYDPQGGLFATPLARTMVQSPGVVFDPAPLRLPGFKVLHTPDIDYHSSCQPLVACLREIRAWSAAHPDHVPILVTINPKDEGLPIPGAARVLPYDDAAWDALDAEIRSVFPEATMITPDQVQGRHPTLSAAVRAGGWPTLAAARGRVIFALDGPRRQVDAYRGQRRNLEGRVMFVNIDEESPVSAYITLNDPVGRADRIRAAVAAGIIVRTRADADTVEARANDTRRREAAFASGAQYVSTDYVRADARFSPYSVAMPGGVRARVSPSAR